MDYEDSEPTFAPIIPDVSFLTGNCLDVLPTLPEASFQTCVTSPPYFGLRDYGNAEQIGRETSPDDFVSALSKVFQEVRRVLRPDGTLWLNLGDSYRNKQLQGIPWRVALRLQSDGWWLRSAIVWHKLNPMPESVKDRPTNCYEMLFMFGNEVDYYYNGDNIKEPCSKNSHGSPNRNAGNKYAFRKDGGVLGKWTEEDKLLGRRARNVWTILPKPYKGAHCAVMPPELAERCIKAGSKQGDAVLDPFGGAGTTGLVAKRLQRNATLIELNPAYVAMARERINGVSNSSAVETVQLEDFNIRGSSDGAVTANPDC